VTYLAACMTFRDEALYLREWIEFHRLVGVEHFYMYDNGSTDGSAELLDLSDVTFKAWPGECRQEAAYDDCLATADARWVAFIDADEFLFNPRGRPVQDILREYEEFPGVGVNLAIFGTGGHVEQPDGLVTESYLYRAAHPQMRWVKCIVDPRRTDRCLSVHEFAYSEGYAVDVAKRPLERWQTQSVVLSRLRINHYHTKSLEEYRAKLARPRANDAKLREPPEDWDKFRIGEEQQERDETILQYVPGLR
jgi:glycosyltransferase involved in cell wall biosynthesis